VVGSINAYESGQYSLKAPDNSNNKGWARQQEESQKKAGNNNQQHSTENKKAREFVIISPIEN